MSILLNLPKRLEKQLHQEAASHEQPLEEYLLDLIQQARQPRSNSFQTTADVLAYWKAEGVIGVRPARTNSQKLARELRGTVEKRKR
ncbi:MAG: hypothetical protein U0796_08455 [Gemmatales bacterium]